MKKRNLRLLMVALALIPVILTIFLARNLYQRKGVPEALESLTRQLFMSEEDERKAQEDKGKAEEKAEELKSTYDALIADLKGEVESKDIKIRKFREKLEINFVDKVLFVSGSAEITSQGREILSKVGQILRRVPDKKIYIVGHTDDVPINSFIYPSNWELSTSRSASVCRFLIDNFALDPTRFTAMGRAYYQPVASNATAEGRQENRRVEIIIADFPGLEGESGQVEMRSPTADPARNVKERELESTDSGQGMPSGAGRDAGAGKFFDDAMTGGKAAQGEKAASAPTAEPATAQPAPEPEKAQGAAKASATNGTPAPAEQAEQAKPAEQATPTEQAEPAKPEPAKPESAPAAPAPDVAGTEEPAKDKAATPAPVPAAETAQTPPATPTPESAAAPADKPGQPGQPGQPAGTEPPSAAPGSGEAPGAPPAAPPVLPEAPASAPAN